MAPLNAGDVCGPETFTWYLVKDWNNKSFNGVNWTRCERPLVFKFNDREEWCLLVDQYASGK